MTKNVNIIDYKYIDIAKNYEYLKGKKVIIWCRSFSALLLYNTLYNHGISVIGFTDSYADKRGETFAGLRVFTTQEVAMMKNIAIYIATNNYKFMLEILEETDKLENIEVFAEGFIFGKILFNVEGMRSSIKKSQQKIQYIKNALKDDKSRRVFERLLEYRITNDRKLITEIYEPEQTQYFPEEGLLKTEENEIFIDAGAYNGETTYNFYNWVGDRRYSKVYLLEPDSLMFEIMKEYISLKKLENIVCVNGGAYSFSGVLRFNEASLTGSSRITGTGEKKIEVVSIDDMVGDDKVTFIKMDIEGSEMKALDGAKKTIERCKPKLAISIYHREDDMWEIPYYILSKYPWYKIYIRHYSLTVTETVMYATI